MSELDRVEEHLEYEFQRSLLDAQELADLADEAGEQAASSTEGG